MTIAKDLSKHLLLNTVIAATSLLAGLAGKFVIDLTALAAEALWPSITKQLLLQALLLSLALLIPTCLILLWLVLKARGRKFAFGVNWDRKGTPFCSACDVAMYLTSVGNPNSDGLKCPRCEVFVWLIDGDTQATVSMRQAQGFIRKQV